MIALIVTHLIAFAIMAAVLAAPDMTVRELIQRARAFKALGLPRTAYRIALLALANSRAARTR